MAKTFDEVLDLLDQEHRLLDFKFMPKFTTESTEQQLSEEAAAVVMAENKITISPEDL